MGFVKDKWNGYVFPAIIAPLAAEDRSSSEGPVVFMGRLEGKGGGLFRLGRETVTDGM